MTRHRSSPAVGQGCSAGKPSPLMGEGLGGGDVSARPITARKAAASPPPHPSPIMGEGVERSGAVASRQRGRGWGSFLPLVLVLLIAACSPAGPKLGASGMVPGGVPLAPEHTLSAG